MKRIYIIGAGAAGMMAAIAAARPGIQVHIFEQNEKPGKKLFITGKGRCNLTNACGSVDQFLENIVHNPRFLYSAYAGFDNRDMMDLMESHGLRLKVERGERVFPASDKSSDVIRTLSGILKERDVKVHCLARVDDILIEEGRAVGISVDGRGRQKCDAVIVACGGLAYPSTGSTGDGYRFAAEAGHHISDCRPALVPLTVLDEWVKELMGLSLKNVGFTLYSGKRKLYDGFGEMMFTHFGITGPLVLSASSYLAAAHTSSGKGKNKKSDKDPTLSAFIDLKPALSDAQLDERIIRELSVSPKRQMQTVCKELLPLRLIPVVLRQAGIDPHLQAGMMNKAQRTALAGVLKALPLQISGTRGYNEAIVTSGGIQVKEVRPDTMESKLAESLYFAGEVLDVDGLTGGFNLQIAWSTGYAAGKAAAEKILFEMSEGGELSNGC